MTRADKIKRLIDRQLEIDADCGGELLPHLLTYGCKGYNDMTDAEIDEEINNEFGEEDE